MVIFEYSYFARLHSNEVYYSLVIQKYFAKLAEVRLRLQCTADTSSYTKLNVAKLITVKTHMLCRSNTESYWNCSWNLVDLVIGQWIIGTDQWPTWSIHNFVAPTWPMPIVSSAQCERHIVVCRVFDCTISSFCIVYFCSYFVCLRRCHYLAKICESTTRNPKTPFTRSAYQTGWTTVWRTGCIV